jgi:hypothetical protein
MSTIEFNLDSFLSDSIVDIVDSANGSFDVGTEESSGSLILGYREEEYTGTIDYRIRQISYSSLLTLHSCPRKFQLYRLRTTHRTEEDLKSTITFAFGHIVGEGIQLALAGKTEEEIIWQLYLMWHTDLLALDERNHKSFWYGIHAVQKFLALRSQGFLQEYELVYYNGRPACELSFSIVFPDGFRLRGFVDAVLQHRETGKVIVLECKTTGSTALNPATYKNSSQAIGYSVVLDHIFPDLSHYEVLYLIYQTKGKEYTTIPFTKSFLQRALWLRELILDIEIIKMYEEAGVYPMRGESCVAFGRDCEYLQTCTLSTDYLTKPCTSEEEDKTEYQVIVTLGDLLDSQLNRIES